MWFDHTSKCQYGNDLNGKDFSSNVNKGSLFFTAKLFYCELNGQSAIFKESNSLKNH